MKKVILAILSILPFLSTQAQTIESFCYETKELLPSCSECDTCVKTYRVTRVYTVIEKDQLCEQYRLVKPKVKEEIQRLPDPYTSAFQEIPNPVKKERVQTYEFKPRKTITPTTVDTIPTPVVIVNCIPQRIKWVDPYPECKNAPKGVYQIQFFASSDDWMVMSPKFAYQSEKGVNSCGSIVYRFYVKKTFDTYCKAKAFFLQYVLPKYPDALISLKH